MAGRKTRKAWVGLHDPTQTKKMNKVGEFLEKCGFSGFRFGMVHCSESCGFKNAKTRICDCSD